MRNQDVNSDVSRAERIGFDEAVYCADKTIGQIAVVLEAASAKNNTVLLTRLSPEQVAVLGETHRFLLDYDELSRTGFFGKIDPPSRPARIALVTAGTSDTRVSREVARTLYYYGEASSDICDVGVAGLWRLLDRIEEIRRLPIVVAVAGMDASLPSVLGGLVPGVIIIVPTSVGYGVVDSGQTALRASLASCAPGLLVVNIDNGYGAACAALRVLRAIGVQGSVKSE